MIRQEILSFFAEHPGEFVSGEKMSEQLHLTRAAIWKHIQALKDEGYRIESQTKNGYRLLEAPLSLDEWVIKHKLGSSRLGRNIQLYEELGSTNDLAKEMIRRGEQQEGVVILAKRQSAGRGRLQRQWESPLGGIWMSILIQPHLPLADAAKLTLSSSIAVVDALKAELGLEVKIKWPNDLIYQGRKLAGILAEVVGEWNSVHTMIIGIGINAAFPASQLGPGTQATSLQDILGRPLDLNALVVKILQQMEAELEYSERAGFATLAGRWTQRAAGIGEEVELCGLHEAIRGTMAGITADGQLRLDTGHGVVDFAAGELRLRKDKGQENYF